MTVRRKRPQELRSHRWLGVQDLRAFGHRSRLLQMGYARRDWQGEPVIGILDTRSDIDPCHAHFALRVEEIERGIWQAVGFPIELPALSLSEPFVEPTTMLDRDLLAIEAEELIRSHPVDGVVLTGGCDESTPGPILGALAANLPAIFFPAGPTLCGNRHRLPPGSGCQSWEYWAEPRAGTIGERAWQDMRPRAAGKGCSSPKSEKRTKGAISTCSRAASRWSSPRSTERSKRLAAEQPSARATGALLHARSRGRAHAARAFESAAGTVMVTSSSPHYSLE